MIMFNLKKVFIIIFSFIFNLVIYAESSSWNLLKNETWVLADYYDILKSQDRDNLIKKFPRVKEQYYVVIEHNYEPDVITWIDQYTRNFGVFFLYNYESNYIDKFDYYEKKIFIGDVFYKVFIIQNFVFEKNYLNISCLALSSYDYKDKDFIINLPPFESKKQYKLKIYFDGDYFDLYLNNTFIHKFCRIDEASLKEYQNLIKDNKCDLSKVTWPRHADGKCDYDDKIIIPDSVKIVEELKKEFSPVKKQKKSEIIKTPIHEKGEYSITETAEIREEPRLMSTLYTTIGKGSKVVVNRIGRKDTINGIQSNWVKIKIVPGAVNKVGRLLPNFTSGWVFGGYLKKEVDIAK